MSKERILELIDMFDGYGLIVTDDELLSDRADELSFLLVDETETTE